MKKSQSSVDVEKYRLIRRKTKQLLSRKRKYYNNKLTESLFENPKRFWSAVKLSTKTRRNAHFLRTDVSFTTDRHCTANMFNKFFHSVFNPRDTEPPPTPTNIPTFSSSQLSDIELTELQVAEVLLHLDPTKACGPDDIPSKLLIELAYEIAPSLTKLFNMSLSLGLVPTQWKRANITPVFKKEDPTLSSNYRPISLLSVLSKVLERCVHFHCYHHLAPLIYEMQHGFVRGKSTTTQLLEVYHDILESVASGKEVDAIYLDLSKALYNR